MCCIFTWLAWCFDASHRVVVFFMACLISSSFCCLLLTASLAGVAMGYNYSLAEYIDLKETNISVYIKRGVYDDEIADDFDWRRSGKDSDISYKDGALRSGGQPKAAARGDSIFESEGENKYEARSAAVYIKRGVYDDEIADDFDWRRSGKDSDISYKDGALRSGGQPKAAARGDSIFESEGENKYEGSLMRLTSSPNPLPIRRFQPEPPYTTPRTTTNVVDGLLAVADSLPGGSMDRLKAIQAAAKYHEAKRVELATAAIPEDASARIKAIEQNAQIHDARRMDASTTTDKYAKYFNQLSRDPGFPGSDVNARRFDEVQETTPSYKFRDAVFGGQLVGWPTRTPAKSTTAGFFEYEVDLDPSVTAPVPARPGGDPRGNYEDSRRNDYDDSGLPSRKKRSHDEIRKERKLLDDFNIFIKKLAETTLDEEVLRINRNNTSQEQLGNDTSVKIIDEATETKSDLDNVNNKNIHKALHDTNENNGNVVFKEFITKYLEHLTSFGDMERKDHTNIRKRKRSMGYEYKIRGNKQTKSFWWGIVNGAQKQWSRVIMYEDKLISQITDMADVLKQRLKGKIIT